MVWNLDCTHPHPHLPPPYTLPVMFDGVQQEVCGFFQNKWKVIMHESWSSRDILSRIVFPAFYLFSLFAVPVKGDDAHPVIPQESMIFPPSSCRLDAALCKYSSKCQDLLWILQRFLFSAGLTWLLGLIYLFSYFWVCMHISKRLIPAPQTRWVPVGKSSFLQKTNYRDCKSINFMASLLLRVALLNTFFSHFFIYLFYFLG